jgi:hypothetical protein
MPRVQMTDGLVVLRNGHELLAAGQRLRLADGGKALGVGQVHPLRALQVDEVVQGSFPEPDQGDLHPGRIPARQDGEVGPVQMGGSPDRRQQVGGQGQMQHLLLADVDEHPLPSGHLGQLLGSEPFVRAALEGELGEQVLTHQPVLQLTGLREQPEQLLTALHPQRGLHRHRDLLAWTDASRCYRAALHRSRSRPGSARSVVEVVAEELGPSLTGAPWWRHLSRVPANPGAVGSSPPSLA